MELRPFIPDFDYIFVNLSEYSNEEIKEKMFTLASLKISLLILKNIFDPENLEKRLGEFFEVGRLYFQEDKGLKFFESVIRYIYQVTDVETGKVVEAKKSGYSDEEISKMINVEVDLVKKLLNYEEIKIPLHFL